MVYILFVEDEFGDSTVEALEDIGHLVLFYQDGRSAYNDVKDGLRYDLALIDFSLTDFNGEAVMRMSKETNPRIPVISLSTYYIKSKYSDVHLTKPILPSELIEIINLHLQKV